MPPPPQICPDVAVSSSPSSPRAPGTMVTFTAFAGGCNSPTYQFSVAPPGGSFAVQQPWGSSNTFVWDTTGLGTGTWQIEVWARNAGSSSTYDSYAITSFGITTTPPCTMVNLSPSVPSPQAVGTSVAWSASAVGCPSTEYQFLVAPPGGSFAQVQGYGANSSYTWNTTGLSAGTYQVEVWARESGSAAAWEATSDWYFQLT